MQSNRMIVLKRKINNRKNENMIFSENEFNFLCITNLKKIKKIKKMLINTINLISVMDEKTLYNRK